MLLPDVAGELGELLFPVPVMDHPGDIRMQYKSLHARKESRGAAPTFWNSTPGSKEREIPLFG